MKREYRHNNFGIFKDFSVEIGKEEISVTEFSGCSIEEFIDIPREVFRKIANLLARVELLEQIEMIREKLDPQELNRAEVIIAQLNSDKTTTRDLARLEAELDELSRVKLNFNMTKEEFINNLKQVDWSYQYLENPTRYKKAMNFYFEVHNATQGNKEFEALFDEERAKKGLQPRNNYYPCTYLKT